MRFTIKNPYSREMLPAFKGQLKRKIRQRIMIYKHCASEILLDKYFLVNYKVTLRKMCLYILKKCQLLDNGNNEIIVKIPDDNLNTIADFIIYGDGKIKGSKILQYAFFAA